MGEVIDKLDANFVMAVILFLFFFFAGVAAGICDVIESRRARKLEREFYKKHDEVIGRMTDYRVITRSFSNKQNK